VNIIRINPAETADEAPAQADLFGLADGASRFALEVPPEIVSVLDAGAPAFIGVSGGRDSQALAYRVCAHLDDTGHRGQRFLIHSDLGRVEWRDSLPVCERLAQRLGVELIVVRRQAGDMMDRWLSRWAGNVARYENLECVKLILPWSSASQRFCTSELKSQVLAREMRRRFPEGDVVSAVGIRREESAKRARMPAWKQDERTTRRRGAGHTWNPPPRQNSCRLHRTPPGAAMKDGLGSIRTGIQGQGGSEVAAAGERDAGGGVARGWHRCGHSRALARRGAVQARPRAGLDCRRPA
jgi:3'-phosphoadenosine 5'-phosphosulfate sulfotransferase (PAPS reductase)/FAD synthetase